MTNIYSSDDVRSEIAAEIRSIRRDVRRDHDPEVIKYARVCIDQMLAFAEHFPAKHHLRKGKED